MLTEDQTLIIQLLSIIGFAVGFILAQIFRR